MSVVVGSAQELHELVGKELGPGDWVVVTQDRIDGFADVSGDHQWIHVDPVRAATGPFGTTIAHGYLTLSLIIPMLEEVLVIQNRVSSINYGLDKVRFPAPVPVDSRLRMSAMLAEVADVDSGVQLVIDCVVHIEGHDRPACAARVIHRHIF